MIHTIFEAIEKEKDRQLQTLELDCIRKLCK